MIVEGLIKVLSDLCTSYLTENERIYYEGESGWNKINGNNVCRIAAENGWLDLLILARKNNYYWDSNTCSNAAENGHLEVLKWARQNGCDWDWRICSFAARNGNLEILNWIRDNGCKCDGQYH